MTLDPSSIQQFHNQGHRPAGVAVACLDHLDLPGRYTQECRQAGLRVAEFGPDRLEGCGIHSGAHQHVNKHGADAGKRSRAINRADRDTALFFVVNGHPGIGVVAFILPFRLDLNDVAALDHDRCSVAVASLITNIVRAVKGFLRGDVDFLECVA